MKAYSAGQLAKMLGVHANTIKRISPEELPYFRITSRGDRRYWEDDVQTYIDKRTINKDTVNGTSN